MKLFESRGLEFEPGSKWAYSNYGLVLLGGVIEKVPGMSYYDFLSENIFEKGGMHSTGSLPEAAPAGAGYGFGAWRGCARHERRTAGLSEDGDRGGGAG